MNRSIFEFIRQQATESSGTEAEIRQSAIDLANECDDPAAAAETLLEIIPLVVAGYGSDSVEMQKAGAWTSGLFAVVTGHAGRRLQA